MRYLGCAKRLAPTHKQLPRLMTMSSRRALRAKQVETEDPLVAQLAETGAEDPEYIDMVKAVQDENFDIPKESELKKIKDHKQNLSVVTLESGHKLIIRNDCEILVPRKAREKMCQTLHFTHHSEEMMMKQTKDKIFWPSMKSELRNVYETCQKCRELRPSKAQEHNEVSQQNLFDSYLPGQRVLIDYAVDGTGNYLAIVCALTGFIRCYKTSNQSKNEAVRCMREWGALYGMPYAIKVDSGPAFRLAFEQEMENYGVKIIHSSAYHPQSQGLVERSVRTLKEILSKNKNKKMSQTDLNEHLYALNCLEDGEKGSAMSRFMGRATRTMIPNSLRRAINWRKQIQLRGEQIEKRVQKRGRTEQKKLTFEEGEEVWVQCLKSGRWKDKGIINSIRVSDDGTIKSYAVLLNGVLTSRHRRFLAKVVELHSGEENNARAPTPTGSQE